MAPGRAMLRHLGATGLPIVHVENASASGSAAFRHACMEVAAGLADIVLVVGRRQADAGRPRRVAGAHRQPGRRRHRPLHPLRAAGRRLRRRTGASVEDIALVAVKNHRNGAKNPFAQHQKERTLDEILGGKKIAGGFTSLQCTPVGEGAAAVIVASEEGLRRHGLGLDRAVRVALVGRPQPAASTTTPRATTPC